LAVKFEWNEAKAKANLTKHGINFTDAARIFDDHAASHVIDDSVEYGEERMKAVGIVDGAVLVVVYAERGERIRLISARKATRREIHDHFEERRSGSD
jgi:uncharacterized protein